MAQPQITFNIGEGGLGRPLTGKDHYSGILWWNDNLPAGYGTDNVKAFFSLEEAEAAGITSAAAQFDILHYQVSEFFRINPLGVLYVGIFPVPATTYDYTELETMQNEANGDIRQFAVWENLTAFTTAPLTTIQSILTGLLDNYQPSVAVYSADFSAIADLGTLTDLTGLAAEAVSVAIGQDGDAVGAGLATSEAQSIPTIGAQLGAISFAKVSDSIAWVGKFPLVTGNELKVPALANGDKVSTKTPAFLNTLNDRGYTFIKRFVGRENTYFNNSLTATSSTSDFSTTENNRTIQKAVREIYVRSLDLLNSPITVNPDGTLTEDAIQTFRSKAVEALDQMAANTEISAFEVLIDPSQDVLSTSKIEVTVKIVPVGVAREIVYNIGFTTNI